MIPDHLDAPDSDVPFIDGRCTATRPNAISRRLGPPEQYPEDEVYRWEDDGGAVLALPA